MDLIEYERHTRSEAAARRYFLKYCWSKGKVFCPKCGHAKVYTLADKRYRCPSCKYTFHDFSRRWINTGGLTCRDWMRLIKLFELDLTANKMAPQLKLSYNTVYKALTALRFAILTSALDAPQLLCGDSGIDLGFDGKKITLERREGRMSSYPVFGIIEKSGWVFVDHVPHIQAETVLHFNLNFSLKLTRMGNIVYTDRYRHYDALIFCGDEHLPLNFATIGGKSPYLDTLPGHFWGYARKRLRQYNGVTSRRFPLYLKELEFRYNNRGQDVFPLLAERICSLVPVLK